MANSENEIYGNVNFDEKIPSLGEVCKNAEIVKDNKSKEQQSLQKVPLSSRKKKKVDPLKYEGRGIISRN